MSKHIVLLGGGHTHALLLKQWLSRGLPGQVKVTLVSESPSSWYSGAIHAVISGAIDAQDAQIPLRSLCERLGVQFVPARVLAVSPFDSVTGTISAKLSNGQTLLGDIVSLNTGSTVPKTWYGADPQTAAVRPLGDLLRWVSALSEKLQQGSSVRVTIVGGGIAAIELCCALIAKGRELDASGALSVCLVEGRHGLAAELPDKARRWLGKYLQEQGVRREVGQVSRIDPGEATLANGQSIKHDFCLWAAAKQGSVEDIGFPLDGKGFVLTRPSLQSTACDCFFAVGDAGSLQSRPHAKNGVYAVRQARVLRQNIEAILAGSALSDFTPQPRYLILLAVDRQRAVAVRGAWFAVGRLWYLLKRWIDQRFVDSFR